MEGASSQSDVEKQKARDAILDMRQEIDMMGGNDYELPEIGRILGCLERGEYTPTEAVEMVYKIKKRKGDYH